MDSEGNGVLTLTTKSKDGVINDDAFTLQVRDAMSAQFVSRGLRVNSDWVSSDTLQQTGQEGIMGTLVKE